jgi:predicted membrane protein
MVAVLFIFAFSGLVIAISIVYAAIQLIISDRELKRSERRFLQRRKQTLIEISSTCKDLKNADNDTTKAQLLSELGAIRRWIEKHC